MREAIQRLGPTLGRTEAISSLTTTTAVCSTLASGGLGGERYRNYWMMRLNAASSADYFRRCTSFTASSGTFTHAGTNYSDTTATSEYLDFLAPDLEPYLLFAAAQEVIPQIKRLDVLEMPAYGGDRYNLGAFSWVKSDSDIHRVTWRPTRQLGRNRSFERWNGYDTSGNLTADHWTLAGSGATLSRSTTGARNGYYTAAMTRAGTDCTLTQTIGLLDDGVDSLQSQTVTVALKVTTSAASSARIFISDGVTTTNSSYHTGGGTMEELTASHTLSASATTLTFGVELKADGTSYIDECYIVLGSSITDTDRKDQFIESAVNPYWLKDVSKPTAQLPARGIGSGQYLFYVVRGYPAFDATRLAARTAGPDTTDAPILTAALGIAGLVFRQLSYRREEEGNDRFGRLAGETWADFERSALDHYTKNLPADGGIELPKRQYSIPAARFAGRRG